MSGNSIESAFLAESAATCETEASPIGADTMDTLDEHGPSPSTVEANILVFSDAQSSLQRELSRMLNAQRFRVMEFCELTAVERPLPSRPALVLSLSIADNGALEHHHKAVSAAAEYGCPWMAAVLIHSQFLLVAPLLSIDSKPCYPCVWACVNRWLKEGAKRSPGNYIALDPTQAAFAAGVIIDAVEASLPSSQQNSGVAGEQPTVLYDLYELSSENPLLGRVPGCPVCWPLRKAAASSSQRRIYLPALFEECSRSREVSYTEAGAGLPKKFTGNPRAAQTRSYPNSRKISLPVSSNLYRERSISRESEGELRLQELAEILFLTFGRWNEANAVHPDRVLPSAGNLGSPQAFIVARDIRGLEQGLYFYLEANHSLARIESARLDAVSEILRGFCATSTSKLPDALLILVGSYARISAKYGAFAYRLAHFDSGICVAHLRTAARALSLTIHEMNAWPNRMLEKALAIDGEESPIMAVVGLGVCDPLEPPLSHSPIKEYDPGKYYEELLQEHEMSSATLARKIQELSQRELPLTWEGVQIQTRSWLFDEEETGEPTFQNSRTELWSQLQTRRSVRYYEDTPVASIKMANILQKTRNSARLRADVQLVKVAATLRTGTQAQPEWQTYELSDDGHVVCYTDAAIRGSLDALFVHKPAACAPLLFWLCGDVRCVAWRYRRILLEAGQQAWDLIYEASCFGLQGHLVGGLWPKRVASALGLRFCDETPLLAFACGLPKLSHHGD
jgi:SagB-type dehydrogenase family enzyme